MLRSHVASCFWMGLLHSFCKMYLPPKDTYFILLNQNGKQYTAKYLARKTALSGGWRGFSIAEKLSEGDALIFQLLQPTKLKVYVVREDESHNIQNFPSEGLKVGTREQNIDLRWPSSLTVIAQDIVQEVPCSDNDHPVLQQAEKSEKEIFVCSSRSSKHVLHPGGVGDRGIASLKDFVTLIDELLKEEYQLPRKIKCCYYQLCCSQNSLLHFNLLKGINPFLIAGSLIEIVNVSVAMKRCELRDFLDELPIWDVKLNSLKILGMKVEFLLSHLDHLRRIAYDPDCAKNRRQFSDLCSEHADSESKIQILEAKLSELTGC